MVELCTNAVFCLAVINSLVYGVMTFSCELAYGFRSHFASKTENVGAASSSYCPNDKKSNRTSAIALRLLTKSISSAR